MAPFGLPPSVFDCVAFVHILGPGHDKLSPHTIKCIFLGNSCTQKGYRCYLPSSRRYFVSVDVTFFESAAFFSESGRTLNEDLISSTQKGQFTFSYF